MAQTNFFWRPRKIEVHIYTQPKYIAEEATFENCTYKEYENCIGFCVLSGAKDRLYIKEIEDTGLVDDYREYLELYFEDGKTETFRNSYVDFFCIG